VAALHQGEQMGAMGFQGPVAGQSLAAQFLSQEGVVGGEPFQSVGRRGQAQTGVGVDQCVGGLVTAFAVAHQ
jgi:hypothetical protein